MDSGKGGGKLTNAFRFYFEGVNGCIKACHQRIGLGTEGNGCRSTDGSWRVLCMDFHLVGGGYHGIILSLGEQHQGGRDIWGIRNSAERSRRRVVRYVSNLYHCPS